MNIFKKPLLLNNRSIFIFLDDFTFFFSSYIWSLFLWRRQFAFKIQKNTKQKKDTIGTYLSNQLGINTWVWANMSTNIWLLNSLLNDFRHLFVIYSINIFLQLLLNNSWSKYKLELLVLIYLAYICNIFPTTIF